MKNSYSEGVRIVQIDTHYVETDAVNFRAVVQSLTGNNASTVWVGNGSSSFVAAAAETGLEAKGGNNAHFHGGVVTVKPDQGINKGGNKYKDYDNVLSSTKMKNLSFKDFERLLSEFPLTEELPWL